MTKQTDFFDENGHALKNICLYIKSTKMNCVLTLFKLQLYMLTECTRQINI